MKELNPIQKDGRYYPLSQIESGDAAALESSCAGFIHGGKLRYLKYILNAGRLKCSDTIRAEGKIKLTRDANSKGPDGQGVYFRFVPSGIRKARILQTFTGPGAAGGFFMFLPSRNLEDLSFFTMSAGDFKYGNPLTLERMKSIADEVRDSIDDGINNSEIAFYGEVPLSKIAEIYIAARNARPESGLDRLLISKGYSPDRRKGKMIRCWMGYPVNGYVNFLRYYRTGAAAAAPSAFSLPSLYEPPSGQTGGSLASQPADISSGTSGSMEPEVVRLPSLYASRPRWRN